jgi:hypothetical protein
VDYEAAWLYNDALRTFMDYWSESGIKIFDLQSTESGKSLRMNDWAIDL